MAALGGSQGRNSTHCRHRTEPEAAIETDGSCRSDRCKTAPRYSSAGWERAWCGALRPSSSISASPGSQDRRARLCPPAWPRAGTLASAPARKYDDKRAEQPIAAENQRLTRTTDPTTLRLARLKSLSFGDTRRMRRGFARL